MTHWQKFIYRLNQKSIALITRLFPARSAVYLQLNQWELVPCPRCKIPTIFIIQNSGKRICDVCIVHFKSFNCQNCEREIALDLSVPVKRIETLYCEYCLPDAPHHPVHDEIVSDKDFATILDDKIHRQMREIYQTGNINEIKCLDDFFKSRRGTVVKKKDWELFYNTTLMQAKLLSLKSTSEPSATSQKSSIIPDDYFNNKSYGIDPFASPMLGIKKNFTGNITFRANKDFSIPDDDKFYMIKKDTEILLDFYFVRVDTFSRKDKNIDDKNFLNQLIEYAGKTALEGLTVAELKEIYSICKQDENCTETQRCELYAEFKKRQKHPILPEKNNL